MQAKRNVYILDNITFCIRFKWERAVNFQKQSLDKIEVKLKEFDDMSIKGYKEGFGDG